MADKYETITKAFTELAKEIVFVPAVSIKHKPGGILKTALNIINKRNKTHQCNKLIFNFLDFDSFAQIKELYSSNIYTFIPTWDEYFEFHKIKKHCIKKLNDPIRLIFTKIKNARSPRDGVVRSPYWLNIDDIDYAGYYKLIKFLILNYYTVQERFNASKLSVLGRKAAMETNAAYIVIDGHRVKSIEQCIDNCDEVGLSYLIETLELKPTWGQLNKIEKRFPKDITDMITYYFE
jgi:hypothetical protein